MAFICCRDMKPFWTGPAWRVVIICLLALNSLPSDGQFTKSSSFAPPSGVQSSVNNHIRRFNIRAGESFTIACNVQNPTQPFIAELYLDGRSIAITDGLLPNTTYSKTGTNGVSSQINLELTFDNFQSVHNGRYDCFANTTDGTTTNLAESRLYGTGPITVTLLTSQYLIFYSDVGISIPTQIRGEFYDIYWYYHATDPLLASAGREALVDGSFSSVTGVGNLWFTQQLVITQGTTPHKAGYYAPEVQSTEVTRRTIMAGESVLVRAYASPEASLPTVSIQSPGADLTVTCTATGYPEPTISISTSDISANTSMGEHVTTTTATPSTVFTTTRSITFSGLLATDCGMVTCTASNANRDGTQTAMDITDIKDSPDVSIAPSADQAISIGGSLTLSCTAQDCTTSSFVYMWYRDGFNVENSTSLSISGASSSDFGQYECNATGDGGTGSAVIYISEQNYLTLTSELSAPPNPSLSTVEGSSVDHYNIESLATFSISCTFESPNDFDLEASKDGAVLSTDPASNSTLSSPTRTSKTLTIQLSSFSTSDNGVYQCNASNSDRELLSRRVLLTTGALSAMRVSEEFIELVPPNSLQLEVSVDGAFSSLQWYRGSQQLMEGSGGISFSDFSRSLTMSNTSSSDAGQYQLIASDDTTNVSIIFEVQVFLEPNFTISTTPEVVVIEDSVNVSCSAQFFPEPFNLRLVFNGSNLTASTSSPAEFSESSRQYSAQTVYTIDSAQPDDHVGSYTCTVEVTRGSPSSTTTYTSAFFLDVNGPTAPNVTVDATPESVAVGGSGVLVCQASGGQPASYSFSWSNSAGDTVSSGVTSSGSRSTLNITEAADADFDTYTCTVSSAYWNVSASGNFTELVPSNEAASVQIHIRLGSKCTDFIESDTAKRQERLTRIETVIKNATTNCFRCQVSFGPSSAFRCIGSNELVVVFVAEIAFSYPALSPASPLDLLRSWARESPVLSVGGLLLQVDGSCSVEIASVSATPKCDPVSSLSTPMSSPTSTDQLTLIIAVVVSCVGVAVLVGAGAVLLVAVCVVRKKKGKAPSASSEDMYAYTHPDGGVEIQRNPGYEMTGPVSEDASYESICSDPQYSALEDHDFY